MSNLKTCTDSKLRKVYSQADSLHSILVELGVSRSPYTYRLLQKRLEKLELPIPSRKFSPSTGNVGKPRKWTYEQLYKVYPQAESLCDLMRLLGLRGEDTNRIKKHLDHLGLDIPCRDLKTPSQITEMYRKRNRDYRKSNSEKFVQYERNRRALQSGAEGSFTAKEFSNLCYMFNNECLCCGEHSKSLTADHVIPLTKGGTNDISNIQPLCGPCNSSKRTKTVDYRPLGVRI